MLLLAIWDLLFAAALLIGAATLTGWGLLANGGTAAAIAGLLAGIYGGLHLLAGLGLLRMAAWARLLRIALAIVELLGFPVLTFVSILVLVMLVDAPMRALFSQAPPPGVPLPGRRAGLVPGTLILMAALSAPVVGIVASIAIPNLLNAIDRGKRKRTMADLRSLSQAIESYRADHDGRPPQVDDLDALLAELEPTYVHRAPRNDAWNHPLVYRALADRSYELVSPGKDGELHRGLPLGAIAAPEADIVLQDGEFVQWTGRALD